MKGCVRHWCSMATDWQVVLVAPLIAVLLFPERVPPYVMALALIGLPGLWMVSWLGRGAIIPRTPLDFPWLIVLGALAISVWASAVPEQTLPQVYKILISIGLYYAVVNSVRNERKLGWAAGALLGGTFVIAGFSLVGMAVVSSKLMFLPEGLRTQIPRLITPFWNPKGFHSNIVGGTLAVMVPVTLAYAWGTQGWRRAPLLLLLALEGGVLVWTQSRGGIIGFSVGVAIIAVARDRRWGYVLLILGGAATVGTLVYGPGNVLDILVSGVTNPIASAQGRLELWSRALYMIADFPFSGIGMGMFSRIVPVLYPLFLIGPDAVVEHPHNLFLQTAVDYGLPAFIAWLAQMGLLLSLAVGAVRQTRGGRWWPLAAGLLGGLGAYLVHGLTDSFTYYAKGHTLVWGFLSLIVALSLVLRSTAERNGSHGQEG